MKRREMREPIRFGWDVFRFSCVCIAALFCVVTLLLPELWREIRHD